MSLLGANNMWRLVNSNEFLDNCKLSVLLNNRNVYIFSAGKLGEAVAIHLNRSGINVKGFFDNDSHKWGREINGIEVLNPEEIRKINKFKDVIIIANPFSSKEISNQLKGNNIDEQYDVINLEYYSVDRFIEQYISDNKYSQHVNNIESARINFLQNNDILPSSGKSVGEYCKASSSPQSKGEFLMKLIRVIKPDNCLELGTNFGISAAYQACGLELNGKGRLITIEYNRELLPYSDDLWDKIGIKHRIQQYQGKFEDVLSEILSMLQEIDFVYIDGNHRKEPTLSYFNEIYPFLRKDSVVVFDDITWSDEMKEAWMILSKDQRINNAFEVHDLGVCLV